MSIYEKSYSSYHIKTLLHRSQALARLWFMRLFFKKTREANVLTLFFIIIQIFYFCLPLFFSIRHCFRGWWKINLKVCDIINCLNKNLITHSGWYLKKERRYDIETLSIDRVLNKEHFYWEIMQKICTRGYSQTPFYLW